MLTHGSYTLERHDQVIILSCIGAWNDYTAIKMCQEFLQLAKTIHNRPWAVLTDVSEWELGPPDMWLSMEKLRLWSMQNNQACEAVVSRMRFQRLIMKRHNDAHLKVKTEYFGERSHAIHWLTELQFPLSEQNIQRTAP